LKKHIITKQIPYTNNYFNHFAYYALQEKEAVLLESGRDGRYSIIAKNPIAKLRGKNNVLTIEDENGKQEITGNPIDLAKDYISQFTVEKDAELPPFQGGAIGYFTYDCNHYIENLPNMTEDLYNIPDVYLLIFDEVVIFDHEQNTIHFIVLVDQENQFEVANQKLEELVAFWNGQQNEPLYPEVNQDVGQNQKVHMSEDYFIDAVEKVKEYIVAGDVFQVNLSVLQSQPLQTHPLHIYEQLRKINPSPYMSYLELGDFQVVSCSPELLVAKRDDEVWTRPIAGTRSRGKTPEEDQILMTELRSNEKEQAEHIMLVDLERNDMGKVCEFGTVEVNELLVIEKYSHVMHLVSNVRGKLKKEYDSFDLLKAAFPGGTITGAPKIRTMEIIEELEPYKRGIYTGSIGWISYTGDMEMNIAIRTMVTKDQTAFVQAGAGIVIDSNPKNEYLESLKKAKALWASKKQSEDLLLNGGDKK